MGRQWGKTDHGQKPVVAAAVFPRSLERDSGAVSGRVPPTSVQVVADGVILV